MVQKVLKYKIWNEIPLFYLFPLFICSYFSVGFHHFDEHFQILEYANYKMGYSPASDLPWEFGEKIRPTLQPWITVFFWKISNLFFEFNPFQFAFFLRFLTAVMSIVALVGIRRTLLDSMDDISIKWYYRFSFLLWFMPFVMVRYSSETWSALTMVYGMIFLFSRKKLMFYMLAGVLFSLSIWFRFQIAFALLGLGLWIVFFEKDRWRKILGMTIGFAIALLAMIRLDTLFYDTYVFTPYNYYYQNIVLKVAENFGTYGVWYYPAVYLLHLIPPISFLLLFFIIMFLKNNIKDKVTWIFIFFVIPHFFISHKELRFLFPMFVWVPYIFVRSFNPLKTFFKTYPRFSKITFCFNGLLLLLSVFKPADINVFNLKQLSHNGQLIYHVHLPKELNKRYFSGLTMNFYRSLTFDKNLKFVNFSIDTISNNEIVESPFLIQDNQFKCLFLTKMGDDFEKFRISRKENHPND